MLEKLKRRFIDDVDETFPYFDYPSSGEQFWNGKREFCRQKRKQEAGEWLIEFVCLYIPAWTILTYILGSLGFFIALVSFTIIEITRDVIAGNKVSRKVEKRKRYKKYKIARDTADHLKVANNRMKSRLPHDN